MADATTRTWNKRTWVAAHAAPVRGPLENLAERWAETKITREITPVTTEHGKRVWNCYVLWRVAPIPDDEIEYEAPY